jgi:hypothetical protein
MENSGFGSEDMPTWMVVMAYGINISVALCFLWCMVYCICIRRGDCQRYCCICSSFELDEPIVEIETTNQLVETELV